MRDEPVRSGDVVPVASAALGFPERACARLYERAKDEQWHVDRDVAWAALDIDRLGAPIRNAMATVYGQVYFGEVVALSVTSEAVARVPDLWAKLFGATQVMDEARHVEFFARVTARLGDPVPALPALRSVAEELASAATVEERVLGTQVLLEGFAQAVFHEGARVAAASAASRVELPGSRAALALSHYVDAFVGKDELRHVAFGVLLLRMAWERLDRRSRTRLEERALTWSNGIAASIDELSDPLRRLGISAVDLKARVVSAQRARLRSVGFGAP